MKRRRSCCCARPSSSSRGTTLLENMIALSIFTAGVAAVVTLTDEIAYTNELANEIATATTLARNLFEDMRTRDPEERVALGITGGSTGRVNGVGEPSPTGRYTIEWDFVEEKPHDGLEMLTITVRWIDPRGHERSSVFHSGMRKGWPVPIIIPETATDHQHGRGHDKKQG